MTAEPGPYSTSWEKTGPLIQKHEISLRALVDLDKTRWFAEKPLGMGQSIHATADEPLEAVCQVLVKMSSSDSR